MKLFDFIMKGVQKMNKNFEPFLPIFQLFLQKGLSVQDALNFVLINQDRLLQEKVESDNFYFIYNGMELYCLFIPGEGSDYLWSLYNNGQFFPLQQKSQNVGTLKNGDAIIETILKAGQKYLSPENGNKELTRPLSKFQFNSNGYHFK